MAWVPRKSHGLMRLALLHEDDRDDSTTASPRRGSGGVNERDVGSPLPSIGDMVRHAAARDGNGDGGEEQDVVADSQDEGNGEEADDQVAEQAEEQAEEQAVHDEEDPVERWLRQRRRNRVNAQPSDDDDSDHEGQNDGNEAEMGHHLDQMMRDDNDSNDDHDHGDDDSDGDGGGRDDHEGDGNYSFAGSHSDHDERDQFHDDFALDAPDDGGDDDAGEDDADDADDADIADAEDNGDDAQAQAEAAARRPWNIGDRPHHLQPLMATRLPGGGGGGGGFGGFGGLGGFAGFGGLGGAFANIAGLARRRGADYDGAGGEAGGGGVGGFAPQLHPLNGAFLPRRNVRFHEQEEIDLTALSSDSEDGGNGGNGGNGNEDDDVEIVGISAPTAAGGSNAAGPRSRKRRRPNNNSADSATAAPPPFDTKSADSTNISMENNETIERFKKALKCSVCLDVIQDMTSTMCGHVYCGHCIKLAIRVTGKCPLCQRPLRPTDIHGLFF